MATTAQIVSMIRSHGRGDKRSFLAVAEHVAHDAAKAGRKAAAETIIQAVKNARDVSSDELPRELVGMVKVLRPAVGLDGVFLPDDTRELFREVLEERDMAAELAADGLKPRRKLLLTGAPGTGKTLTAAALAAELGVALHVTILGGIVSHFMGETSAKLVKVFEAISERGGVWLFDEFDALASSRERDNDIGEARRILNTLLTLIEDDRSDAVIVAATNLPGLLDRAMFRRFDAVVRYENLDKTRLLGLMQATLAGFDTSRVDWDEAVSQCGDLGQADVVAACRDAARDAVLRHARTVQPDGLARKLGMRTAAYQ